MDRSKEIEEYIKDFRDNRKQHKRIYLNKNQKKLMEAFRRRLKDLLSQQIKEQEIVKKDSDGNYTLDFNVNHAHDLTDGSYPCASQSRSGKNSMTPGISER